MVQQMAYSASEVQVEDACEVVVGPNKYWKTWQRMGTMRISVAGLYEFARRAAAVAVGFEKSVVLVGIPRGQEAGDGMCSDRVQYYVSSVAEHLQRWLIQLFLAVWAHSNRALNQPLQVDWWNLNCLFSVISREKI